MVGALLCYLQLARSDRLAGAGLIAAGIILNLAAAAAQASGTILITVVWPFDHNSVFHIIQTVALVVLLLGLRRGLAA